MSYATLAPPRCWINNSSSNWAPKPSHLPEIHFPLFRCAAPKVWLFIYTKLSRPVIRPFLRKMSHTHWTTLLKTPRNCVLARKGTRKKKKKRNLFDEGVYFVRSTLSWTNIRRRWIEKWLFPSHLSKKSSTWWDIRGHKSTRGPPPTHLLGTMVTCSFYVNISRILCGWFSHRHRLGGRDYVMPVCGSNAILTSSFWHLGVMSWYCSYFLPWL